MIALYIVAGIALAVFLFWTGSSGAGVPRSPKGLDKKWPSCSRRDGHFLGVDDASGMI
jgi:hypothetical protein